MTKPLRTHYEAEAEIRAAISWYEMERAGLGRELWDQLQHTVGLISEHPAIGSVVHRVKIQGTARRVPLRRFPYFLYTANMSITSRLLRWRIPADVLATGACDAPNVLAISRKRREINLSLRKTDAPIVGCMPC